MARSFLISLLAVHSAFYSISAQIEDEVNPKVNCTIDGFLPHATNCRAFYWCSLRRSLRAIILECDEDQIFDSQTQSCTYPWLSTREECGGTLHLSNEVEEDEQSEQTQEETHQSVRNLPSECEQEGFLPDEDDCAKFYRCTSNGGGRFLKYEFSCGEGTVWDAEINACNHPWATRNIKCGGMQPSGENNEFGRPVPDNPEAPPRPIIPDYNNQQQPVNGDYNNPSDPGNNDYNNPNYYENIQSGSYPTSTQDNNYNNAYPAESVNNPNNHYDSQQPANNNPNYPTNNQDNNYNNAYPGSTNNQDNNPNNYYDNQQPANNNQNYPPNNQDNNNNNAYPGSTNNQDNNPNNQQPVNNNPNYPTNNQDNNYNNAYPGSTNNQNNYYDNQQPSNNNPNYPASNQDNNNNNAYPENTNNPTNNQENNNAYPDNSNNQQPPPSLGSECQQGGFLGDARDCKKFYRCVENGRGAFTKYEFSCAQGTVWDPEVESCNYQWAAKRSNCGESNLEQIGSTESENPEIGSEIDPTPQKETSSTQNIIDNPNKTTKPAPTSTELPSTTQINMGSSSTTSTDNNSSPKVECTKEDFIPDSKDCKKFYRCVSNGANRFIKYEFTCGEGTVWDTETKACNHPSQTRNACGTGIIDQSSAEINSGSETSEEIPGIIVGSTETSEETSSGEAIFTENPPVSSTENSQSIENNNEQSTSSNEHSFQSTETNDNSQSTASNNGQSSTEHSSSQSTETNDSAQSTASNNGQSSTEASQSTETNDNKQLFDECKQDGFIGDSKNCKKFYRCVPNGKRGFIKYEFKCGEGTVWDNEQGTCNYPHATRRQCEDDENEPDESITEVVDSSSTIDSSNLVGSSESQPEETSTNDGKENTSSTDSSNLIGSSSTESKPEETTNDSKENISSTDSSESIPSSTESESSSPSESSGSSESTSSSTEGRHPSESTESELPSQSDVICSKEGFIGDPKDCKKFYRCVGNGHGRKGFTKYEFSCGEGTVWDSELDTCNHAANVRDIKCGSGSGSETGQQTTSSPEESADGSPSTFSPESSSSEQTGSSSSSETEQQSTSSPTESADSSSTISPESSSSSGQEQISTSSSTSEIAQQSTVSSGENSSTQPPESSTSAEKEINEQPSTSSEASSSGSQTTEQSTASSSPGNEPETSTESKESSSTSQLEESTQSSDIICSKEGFVGDPKDCKKFYRCVGNGHGRKGFTKYEFTCGEGTVWDSDLDTCNHPANVRNGKCTTDSKPEPGSDKPGNEQYSTIGPEESSGSSTQNPESSTETAQQSSESSSTQNPESSTETQTTTTESAQHSTVSPEETSENSSSSESSTETQTVTTTGSESSSSAQTESTTIGEPASSTETDMNEKEISTTEQGSSSTEQSVTTEQSGSSSTESTESISETGSPSTEIGQSSTEQSGTTPKEETSSSSTTDIIEPESPSESSSEATTQSFSQSSEGTTQSSSSESTTQSESSPGKETPTQAGQNRCTKEGFFPNIGNCNKFYRCVSNGKGFTKYDFSCGPGTIWDPDLDTCNHPYAVSNKMCEQGPKPTSKPTGKPTVKPTTPSGGTGKPPSGGQSQDKCTGEGFYPNSKDCKKFFRCVGNGRGGYSKYDFTCSEGTIFDPDLQTCNYPYATENKACGHSADKEIGTSEQPQETTTPKIDEQTSSTEENYTATEVTTITDNQQTTEIDIQSTTEELQQTTEDHQTTTDVDRLQTTTEVDSQQTTTDSENSQQTTEVDSTQQTTETDSNQQTTETGTDSNQQTTTEGDSNQQTTEYLQTTTEVDSQQTTESESQQTTTNEQGTTEAEKEIIATTELTTESESRETTTDSEIQSTTVLSEITTEIDASTTEANQQTTITPDSTEQTTSENEQTTISQESTTTKEESTTSEEIATPKDESTTLVAETTTDSSVLTTDSTTTDLNQLVSSTEQPDSNQTVTPCPISELEGDQINLVCPTGFKRHPKYCNLFYQCTHDPNIMEVKILVLSCPSGTIYDDQKIQCLPPAQSEQKCMGEIKEKEQFLKSGLKSAMPLEISSRRPFCPSLGSFSAASTPSSCQNYFIKCQTAPTQQRTLRAYVHQCPDDHVFWPISKRCEKQSPALGCTEENSEDSGEARWMIPVEVQNVASGRKIK